VASVVERVTVLSATGALESAAVTVHGGGILRDSFVRAESPKGRAVVASYGIVNLVNVTAIATDAEASALYTDPSVGGICIPDSHVDLNATNVIARGGKYDVDVPHVCGSTPGPAIEVAFMTHSNSGGRRFTRAGPVRTSRRAAATRT
jgi:hypothetical protein